MNSNVGIQHRGLLVWTGAAAIPRDIRRWVRFGFVFEVFAAIVADAHFLVKGHNPTVADNCLPDVALPVFEVPICNWQNPGTIAPAEFIIPAGTPIGTICAGTIPCYPNAFVSLAGNGGTVASVRAVIVLDGPMIA